MSFTIDTWHVALLNQEGIAQPKIHKTQTVFSKETNGFLFLSEAVDKCQLLPP